MDSYKWKVGDVFIHRDGTSRWAVDRVFGNDTAVLRSCSTSWATTTPLTYAEWNDRGQWHLARGDAAERAAERSR